MHRTRLLAIAVMLVAGASAAAPDPFPLPDLARLFDAARTEMGEPLRVYSLEISSDGDTELLVRRNDRPDLVDAFSLADGRLDGPVPVKFDEYPTLEALEWHEIDAREIDLARVPALLDAARAKLKMPDARIVRVSLERQDSDGVLTYENAAIWEVHLDDARHDGYVQFDTHGKVLHAERE
jgi:hypothetical protein